LGLSGLGGVLGLVFWRITPERLPPAV